MVTKSNFKKIFKKNYKLNKTLKKYALNQIYYLIKIIRALSSIG
tara:strand:+ start:288 stop:419 length:132 start_codon:yes stop_codon:yes gene_type:complete